MNADQLDLLITGNVVTPGRVLAGGWIGVRGEIIAALGPAGGTPRPAARRVIDATGQWILPGAVDAHVHCFSEPAEGFTHATRAAAAGGVTTIIEMPYDAEAPVVGRDVLDRKLDRLRRDAVVDVAVLGTIAKSGGLDAVGELAAGGVCGFKASMFETDPARFPRIAHGELIELFRRAAEHGLPVGLHAEDGEIIAAALARWPGPNRPAAHCATRPPVSETAAVAAALELAAATDVHLHIYHASLPHTFELVAAARAAGQPVTAETCPHYLFLSEDDADRLGPFGKINPPLRSAEASRGLWDQVASGVVDMITSDHSPWAIAKKSRPDDIFANASGAPGVQTLLPLAYAGVVAGHGLPVLRLAELVAANPARVFGLAPRKGQLIAGADADLVVLDPAGTTRIHPGAMQSSATWSPYDGMELPGRIGLTMLRGQVVYDGSTVTGPPGGGQLVRPQQDRPQRDGPQRDGPQRDQTASAGPR
jgi:allantoinase